MGKLEDFKIRFSYILSKGYEISVDWNGYNFLVCYGKHSNGWFIAIPNWKVCIEASTPDDEMYNSKKLSEKIDVEGAGLVIAKAIHQNWDGTQKLNKGVKVAIL